MTSVAHPRVPTGNGVTSELRAVRVVWEREIIRFATDRLRLATSLVQPLLFLFVMGTGLSALASSSTRGTSFRTFLFPGILVMAVLFTAMFSAASIVWDREYGFLREMLVAPVRRSSIVLGKCLGGATVATLQGLVVVLLAGLVNVPYSAELLLEVFGLQLLLAYTITAFGVMLAARIRQVQSFMALTQMMMLPLFFLSGALFPSRDLPDWLAVLNRLDPLTYGVEPIRHVVFAHLSVSAQTRADLAPGVTWFGWPVPTLVCAGVVLALGTIMTVVAIVEFDQRD